MKPITHDDFLKDVAKHKMTVLRDDGLYRHIQFKRPGTRIMQFDLITWPGYLCYCGDMGEYVFTRLADMFEFFRKPDSKGGLDLQYWAEKCRAADRSGIKIYDPDHAKDRIKEWVDEADVKDIASLRAAVEEEILPRVHDGEHELRSIINEFEHDGFRFYDFWECDLKEYTVRFIWCCYALPWAIAMYDKEKEATA